ncbi:hypothetical protein GGI07_003309 [Coemansia sp. Benny D115]|nr:hypothetical protein GGI07_003309 [Coemansia sp. Benny D115]
MVLGTKKSAAANARNNKKQALESPYGGRRTGWLRITRSLGSTPPALTETNTKITEIVARGFAKWISKRTNTSTKRGDGSTDSSANTMLEEDMQDLYYAVLDGDNLVMYDGEAMSECRGVIIMSKYRVSLHHRPRTSEAQVYSKKTPIRLSPLNDGAEAQLYKRQVAEYYVYADRPSDKEDWYFALIWSSLVNAVAESSSDESEAVKGSALGDGTSMSPPNSPSMQQQQQKADHGSDNSKPELTKAQRERLRQRLRQSCLVPDQDGIKSILQTISTRGSLAKPGEVREDEWLNAIFGRVFLGAYRTEWARQHFIRKMQTKFDRVEKPIFLDRIVVSDLEIGDNVPVITNFKLESFETSGQVDASMYVHYKGGFKLVLNTGVKIGSLRMSVSLSVVLQSLAGKMLLRFKPAPSNRFWLGFYEMPSLRLNVAPVFMQKQVRYAAVSQAIEKQIYDIVRTTLVLPNLDDTVFFPTTVDDGAILESSLKEFHAASLGKALDLGPNSDDEQPPTDGIDEGDAPAASGSEDTATTTATATAAAGGGAHKAEQLKVGQRRTMYEGTRPLSMTAAELGSDGRGALSHLSLTSAATTAAAGAHQRFDSTDGSFSEGHDSEHSRTLKMVTPRTFRGDDSDSGHTTVHASPSLANSTDASAATIRSSSPSQRSVSSQTKATSIKSVISESAVSFFKRAKDSQAAESAKTWWQSIQQGGNSHDASSAAGSAASAGNRAARPPQMQLPRQKLGTGGALNEQPALSSGGLSHGSPSMRATASLASPLLSRGSVLASPAAAAIGFSVQKRHERLGDDTNSMTLSRSQPQMLSSSADQLLADTAASGAGDVESSIGSMSSGFQFPRLPDSGVNGRASDSALVRRRPAALSQGSEIELPLQRRYSKPQPSLVERNK